MAISKKPVTAEQAKLKMAALCARAEQSEFNISRKLYNLGLNSAAKKEIIDFLKAEKYLDDSRFAKSFASDKARFSSWGPRKIKATLFQHHIPESIIDTALDNIDPKIWKEAIMKCAVAKARSLDLIGEEGWEHRRKLFAYLIGRGFFSKEANIAVKIMKNRQQTELDDLE